jgi:hypothetical protein
MSQDHSTDENQLPPDNAVAGDVSTTGHSTQDIADDHADVGHGAHANDASEVSTLVPVTWRQLIFPALILVLVGILLAGPIINAFSPRPATPTGTEGQTTGTEGGEGVATPTVVEQPSEANPTPQPTPEPQETPTVEPSPTTSGLAPSVIATRTAVALAGEQGIVSRAPVQLEFGGQLLTIKAGNSLLPDWKPSTEEGTATWIEGTYANHILYLPFNPQNEALFKAAQTGQTIKLHMDTGQIFNFTITRSERLFNGPPTQEGQFTVTTAMRQDHAGVTLFLIGDPAADRAVIQADFNGTIQ